MDAFSRSHERRLVRAVGIEPTLLAEPDFESGASTSSTTPASAASIALRTGFANPYRSGRSAGESMKLYDENMPAPNPRKVRIYLAEKGITVPTERVRMMKREHKAPEFLAKNSLGQLPVLELDDGTFLSESVAICRYFEEMMPEPPLFGRSTLERAQVE